MVNVSPLIPDGDPSALDLPSGINGGIYVTVCSRRGEIRGEAARERSFSMPPSCGEKNVLHFHVVV